MGKTTTERTGREADETRDTRESDRGSDRGSERDRARERLVARAGGNGALQRHLSGRGGRTAGDESAGSTGRTPDSREAANGDQGRRLCPECRERHRRGEAPNCVACERALAGDDVPERRDPGPATVRPKRTVGETGLAVGETDHGEEAEAERLADGFVSSRPGGCGRDGCSGAPASRDVLRRSPTRGQSPDRDASGVPDPGPGRPLTGSERGRYEPYFGVDLSAVRLHTGDRARRSADAIGAAAYSVGTHVVLGSDRDDGSRANRRLVAHELAHVVFHNDSATVRRKPEAERNPAEYDPCQVDVGALSNADLLVEWRRAKGFLGSHERGEGDWYDYANLLRRLVDERRERVRAGHVWLADDSLDAVPGRLYELRSAGGRAVQVVPVEGGTAGGQSRGPGTTSLLTPEQFDDYLERQDIPQMNVREFYRRQATRPEGERERLTFVVPAQEGAKSGGGGGYGVGAWPGGGGFAAGSPALGIYPEPVRRAMGLGTPGAGGAFQQSAAWGTQPPMAPEAREREFYDPDAPISGMAGMVGSGLRASPFDLAARPELTRRVYTESTDRSSPKSRRGAESRWRGDIPERSMTSGSYGRLIRYRDLNRIQGNFPALDVGTRFGPTRWYQVTHTEGGVNESRMRKKFRVTIGNTEPRKLDQAIELLNRRYGSSLTVADVNRRNYLAVPDDQVAGTRRAIRDVIAGSSAGSYANLLNAMLRENPIEVEGTTYRSWEQVQSDWPGRLGSDAYRELRQRLAERASRRVVGVGMTMPEITAMQQHRAAAGNLGPREYGRVAPPELLETVRYRAQGMDASAARARSAWGGAGRGGAVGGLASLATGTAGVVFDDSGDPQVVRRLGVDVPLGIAGGAGEAYVETRIGTRVSQYAYSRATAQGVSSGAASRWSRAAVAGRGFGATMAGGMAAPAVTLAGMGIDDAFFGGEYTAIDYTAKGTRSAVSGGIAAGTGWLAAGATGALLGSEAPIIGNIVGFGVGVGAYFLADASLGEAVEEEVREGMGEQGCVGGVSRSNR